MQFIRSSRMWLVGPTGAVGWMLVHARTVGGSYWWRRTRVHRPRRRRCSVTPLSCGVVLLLTNSAVSIVRPRGCWHCNSIRQSPRPRLSPNCSTAQLRAIRRWHHCVQSSLCGNGLEDLFWVVQTRDSLALSEWILASWYVPVPAALALSSCINSG